MSWSQTKIDVRAKKRDEAVIFLTENNIPFSSYNYGAHLRIGRIDFFPGTELFINNGKRGYGIKSLLKELKSIEYHQKDTNKNPVLECPNCGSIYKKLNHDR